MRINVSNPGVDDVQVAPGGRGYAPVSVGLMLHLTAATQIYCEAHGNQPPMLVLGAEPADCVISTANLEVEPEDLIAAERLLRAATAYRDRIADQIASARCG